MSPPRRRWITVGGLATATGAGIGYQSREIGLDVGPQVGVWITVLCLAALLALFRSTPLGGPARVTSVDDASWTEFRRELRRSRRWGRPLTLVRIPGDDMSTLVRDRARDLATLARRLGLRLRLVDRTWVHDGSVYVLLPETTRSAANTLVERIRAEAPGQLPARIWIATFPEDGLTSGAILAALYEHAGDLIPTPLHPSVSDLGEAVAFVLDEDFIVGEAARP